MPDVLTLHQPAPDFSLPADNGEEITLSRFRQRNPVLVFFYPADFTPVCTAEVCAFRDDYPQYQARNITILGISADKVERHRKFAEECRVPFRLLSDVGHHVARLYGAKGLLGMRRAYFLIDQEGNLVWQYAELLPIFKLCNERILQTIDETLGSPAANRPGSSYTPPPHL